MRPMSVMKTVLTVGLAFALGALLCAGGAGCYHEGGTRYSGGPQTVESRTWRPKTMTLVDTRTGEATWTVEIPVGEQLVYNFSQGTGPNEFRPDEIVWEVMPAGRWGGSLNNRQPCPPVDARRMDMALRPAPELPGTAVPGSPYADDEPRPIQRGPNRVVEPIEQ